MKTRTIIIAATLVGLMAGVRFGILERSPEQSLERRSANLADLKTSSLLPTYIGSLFLGSFRAVAIDVLWVQLTRMRQQEHRYFETLEIMDLIAKLQPRNPEVWANQAWDMAYNIANQFSTSDEESERRFIERQLNPANPRPPSADRAEIYRRRLEALATLIPEKRFQLEKWVRMGLLKLLEGMSHLPENAYLKQQVAWTLWHKVSYNIGRFDMQLLKFIETDPILQKALRVDLKDDRPNLTGFELAEHWFGLTWDNIEDLKRERRFSYYRGLADRFRNEDSNDDTYEKTQLGLNLHPITMAGFRYHARYMNAFYLWFLAMEEGEAWSRTGNADALVRHRGLLERSIESFKLAAERADEVLIVFPRDSTGIFKTFGDLCRQLTGLVQRQIDEAPPGETMDRTALFKSLVDIRNQLNERGHARWDNDYILTALTKFRSLTDADPNEYNDDPYAASPLTVQPLRGNLSAGDVDFFVPAPPRVKEDHGHGDGHAPPPRTLRITVVRRGTLDLSVTVGQFRYREVAREIHRFDLAPSSAEKSVEVKEDEGFHIRIQPLNPAGTLPADTSYEIRMDVR